MALVQFKLHIQNFYVTVTCWEYGSYVESVSAFYTIVWPDCFSVISTEMFSAFVRSFIDGLDLKEPNILPLKRSCKQGLF